MRLMIIDSDEKRGKALNQSLARRYGWPLIPLEALTGLHPPTDNRHSFILERPPIDKQQAMELDDALAASGTPLDIIFLIPEQTTNSPPGPLRDNSGDSLLAAHYVDQSLLRRVRGEAADEHILSTLERIIDDTCNYAHPGPDAFDAMLEAVRLQTPEADEEVNTAEPQPTVIIAETAPDDDIRETDKKNLQNWKRTAKNKGKLRRRGSGWKPRG